MWHDDDEDENDEPDLDDREGPDEADRDNSEEPALVPCPFCGKNIIEEAQRCHHCGNYIIEEDSRRLPLWLVVGAIMAGLAALVWIVY